MTALFYAIAVVAFILAAGDVLAVPTTGIDLYEVSSAASLLALVTALRKP